jgi:hypothetical protein
MMLLGSADNSFTIVGGTIAYVSSGTSLSIAYPTGIQQNDLLVVMGYVNSASTFGSISGWTNLGGVGSYDILSWKVADGTETGSVTATWTGSVGSVASMFRIRHGSSNPPTFGSGTGAYGTSPSVTLPTPTSYSSVCHIINYVNNGTINSFTPSSSLTLLNSRTTSYAYYGYGIQNAAGNLITSTTSNAISVRAYAIYV